MINYLIENDIDSCKLDIKNIESYLAKNKKKSISNNTYAKFVNCTRLFLSFLYDRGYLETDIAKKIEPVKKIASIERVILFDNEIKRIEDYISSRKFKEIYNLRDLISFYLGINCGLRRQEIINLNCADIELDEENNPFLKVIESKGKKSRIIYISDSLFSHIKKYKRMSRKYKGSLIRGNYGKKITKTSLQNIFTRIYKESGVYKKGLNIHSLRHTYAERLRKNNTDIATISTLLGHSRVDTTMVYFHINRQDLISAVL